MRNRSVITRRLAAEIRATIAWSFTALLSWWSSIARALLQSMGAWTGKACVWSFRLLSRDGTWWESFMMNGPPERRIRRLNALRPNKPLELTPLRGPEIAAILEVGIARTFSQSMKAA